MNSHYQADYVRVDTLPELLAQEASGKRVWLVTSLERIVNVSQPDLYQYIQEHYRLLEALPGTIGDGTVRIYERMDATQR